MRAAAYARYSTDKQTENSIDTQLSAISCYCREHGHTITSTYIDMAMSGTNTEHPDFRRMLDSAKARQFDCVVAYDISRASRDVGDWMSFRKLMRSLNIEVLSTTEKLGSIDNPNDFLTELLTAGLGQHMVLQTRQKSIAGVAEKAKHGVFLGGYPPLGYDIQDNTYVINSAEAETVRLIYDLYASDNSYDNIIDVLANRGSIGKRGRPLGKNSLYSILQNERYIGVYTWNKKQMKYMGKWAGGKDNPNVIRIEDAVPRIIDQNTWERVQRRMSDNKHNASNTAKYEYLLAGLIECGECGGTYTGKTNTSGKGYTTRYYVCGNKYRTHTCKARNINADELEVAVVAYLKDYFAKGDFDAMAAEIFKAYKESSSSKETERRELVSVEQKIGNLIKAPTAGVDCEEVRDELTRLKVRKVELEELLSLSSETVITKEAIVAKLKKDAQLLQEGEIKRLIKAYITKIYARNDEIVITGA